MTACGPGAGGATTGEPHSPQGADQPEPQNEYASLADLRQRTEQVAGELAKLGFPIDTERLTVDLVDLDTAEQALLAQMKQTAAPELWDTLITFRDMAALHEPITAEQLRAAVAQHATEKILAQYDWRRRALVFRDMPMTQLVSLDGLVAHELVHAHQDQAQGGLEQFFAKDRETLDAARAAYAVMEGQAVLIAGAVLLARQGSSLQEVDPAALDDTLLRVSAGPGLGTVYAAGERFALSRFQAAGFDGVTAAFADPPSSSEQVIHPLKLGTDLPQSPKLPAWPKAAGDATLVHEDVVGELLLVGALSDGGSTADRADTVSTGWDGDRLAVYRTGDGHHASMWRTVWDRKQDAEQFAEEMGLWSERTRGQLLSFRRRGCVVDVAYAPDADRRKHLTRALQRRAPRVRCSPRDAASTARVESAQQRRVEQKPRVENGRWVHARDGISLAIPSGWRTLEIHGAQVLVGQASGDFAETVVVLQDQDVLGTGLEGYLSHTRKELAKNPHQRVLHSEVTELDGQQVGVMELDSNTDDLHLRVVSIVIPRPGRFVVVSMGFLAEDFASRKPVVTTLLRGLQIAP